MKESSIEREKICSLCPIFSVLDKRCNPKLWFNPETNDVSLSPKEGYVKGCGCYLKYKWVNKNAHCIANKW